VAAGFPTILTSSQQSSILANKICFTLYWNIFYFVSFSYRKRNLIRFMWRSQYKREL
jgi:hypothetical protein